MEAYNAELEKIMTQEQYAAWVRQWERTVPYSTITLEWASQYISYIYGSRHNHMTDADNYGAISMHLPSDAYEQPGWNSEFRTLRWYDMLSWQQTGW